MKALLLRDHAHCAIRDDAFIFHGVAGLEFLNTRRTSPMIPPAANLEVKAETIYKIYSGIAYSLVDADHPLWELPDVRAAQHFWRNFGVKVERVEFEEHQPGVQELIIYISATLPFTLNPNVVMFESFSLAKQAKDGLELFTNEAPARAEGFVPIAKKQITDASARREPANPGGAAATERSDEEKMKAFDKFLSTPDEKPQSVTPGAPPASIPARSSHLAAASDPGAKAKSIGGGGVRAATPE